MAIRLKIYKLSSNLHNHVFVGYPNSDKKVSKFYCKSTGDYFKFIEENGSNAFLGDPNNTGFKYDEIEYYGLGGGSPTLFTSANQLMLFLKNAGYEGFKSDEAVDIADLISTDSSNAIVQGTDGKLFAGFSGGASVKWYTSHTNLIGTTITVPLGFDGSIVNLDQPQTKVTFTISGTTRTITSGATDGDFLHIFGLQPNI